MFAVHIVWTAAWMVFSPFGSTDTANAYTPVIEKRYEAVTGDPAVIGYPDGTFIVVGSGLRVVDGLTTGCDIRARRFDGDGNAISDSILIATTRCFAPLSDERQVGAARRADGSFVVVWLDAEHFYTDGSLKARAFDASMQPLTAEITVRSDLEERAKAPSIAVRSDGGFLVVWERELGASPDDIDVFARLYDVDGIALGAEFRVNTYTDRLQYDPYVATTSGDDFVVTWLDYARGSHVFCRLFDSDGSALTDEVPVDDTDPGFQMPSNIVALNTGGFLVTWVSESGPRVRRFDAQAMPVDAPFLVSSDAGLAHASLRADGTLLMVWAFPATTVVGMTYTGMAGKLFDSSMAPVGDEFVVSMAYPSDVRRVVGFVSPTDDSFHVFSKDAAHKGCFGAGPDSDGDAIPDSCDPCENPTGEELTKVSSRFRFIGDGSALDRYTLTGRFALPFPSFSDFDPLVAPLRLRIYATERWPIFDVTLPTTAFADNGETGWTSLSAGRKWKFRSKAAAPASGIVQVLLSSGSDGLVRIKVVGKKYHYPVPRQDINPETAQSIVVNLGDAPGECAEVQFDTPECAYDGLGWTYTCSR